MCREAGTPPRRSVFVSLTLLNKVSLYAFTLLSTASLSFLKWLCDRAELQHRPISSAQICAWLGEGQDHILPGRGSKQAPMDRQLATWQWASMTGEQLSLRCRLVQGKTQGDLKLESCVYEPVIQPLRASVSLVFIFCLLFVSHGSGNKIQNFPHSRQMQHHLLSYILSWLPF